MGGSRDAASPPGEIYGGNMTAGSGLASGERIVAAGVSALREGMKVRPLEAR
jgi:membrane fusion protein, multidrug efflux system